MSGLHKQVQEHFRMICPDMPTDLMLTTTDLAIHMFDEYRDMIIRIGSTAPQPTLAALMAMQLIKASIENELEQVQEE